MRPTRVPGTPSGDGPYTGASAAMVYVVVRALPVGGVTTYGTIARLLGLSARFVGGAMARCPEDVPWWRVVGAGGSILTRRLMDGTGDEQVALLSAEGVVFDASGRVRLELCEVEPSEPEASEPEPSEAG